MAITTVRLRYVHLAGQTQEFTLDPEAVYFNIIRMIDANVQLRVRSSERDVALLRPHLLADSHTVEDMIHRLAAGLAQHGEPPNGRDKERAVQILNALSSYIPMSHLDGGVYVILCESSRLPDDDPTVLQRARTTSPDLLLGDRAERVVRGLFERASPSAAAEVVNILRTLSPWQSVFRPQDAAALEDSSTSAKCD